MTFNYGFTENNAEKFTSYLSTIVSFKEYLDKLLLDLSNDNFNIEKLRKINNLIIKFKNDVDNLDSQNFINNSDDILKYDLNCFSNQNVVDYSQLEDNFETMSNCSNKSDNSYQSINSNKSDKTEDSSESEEYDTLQKMNTNSDEIKNKKPSYYLKETVKKFISGDFDTSKILCYKNNDEHKIRLNNWVLRSKIY